MTFEEWFAARCRGFDETQQQREYMEAVKPLCKEAWLRSRRETVTDCLMAISVMPREDG